MVKSALAGLMRRHGQANWTVFDQAVVSGGNFVTGVLLARALGLEAFGQFTLLWMVVLFVQSIQHAGIIAPMMTLAHSEKQADRPAYYGAVFTHQLIYSATTGLLVVPALTLAAMLFGLQPPALEIQLALIAALTASQVQDFLRRYHFTRDAPVISLIGDMLRFPGQILLIGGLLVFAPDRIDVAAALWALTGAALLSAILLAIPIGRLDWSGRALGRVTKSHWRFGRWLSGAAVMSWLSGNVFIIAAGLMIGEAAAGGMRVGQQLIGVLHILFHAMENYIPGRAARVHGEAGAAGLRQFLTRTFWLGSAATAAVGLAIAAAPAFWFDLLFGAEYEPYGWVAYWLGPAYLAIYAGMVAHFGLRTLHRTSPVFLAYAASALISLAAVYPLLNTFGLAGALAGFLIAPLIKFAFMGPALHYELGREGRAADRGGADAGA
jgi:O-antigen/teichoic acid export membrane protein